MSSPEIATAESQQIPEGPDQAAPAVEPEPYPRYPDELLRAAETARRGTPVRTTVRTLLSWFGAQRRGSFIVWYIEQKLKELGVATDPNFNAVWIDADVSLIPVPKPEPEDQTLSQPEGSTTGGQAATSTPAADAAAAASLVGGAIEDPTYRIGKLDAANKAVISVSPTQPLETAITLMLSNGFSQLPVMQGDRDLKGVVTWESIGARLALGKTGAEVREFMTPAQVISFEKSLFAAIEIITQHQYVLVQAADKRISGIVTSTDLSRQFQQLTEPFLLLSEIEQHIRKLLVGKFTAEELKLACDPNDSERMIESIADLTMGEYIRLLENPKYWARLGLRVDRGAFVDQLKIVRRIRNDVMHFDPDPLGPNDLLSLRQFVLFMQSLRELGAF